LVVIYWLLVGDMRQSGCHSLHPRCEDGQGDDHADQKRAYSRHNAVEVAPPSCFLESFVVSRAQMLGELLFQVDLTGCGCSRNVRVERQGKERSHDPCYMF
jgi:hypothetical protein